MADSQLSFTVATAMKLYLENPMTSRLGLDGSFQQVNLDLMVRCFIYEYS